MKPLFKMTAATLLSCLVAGCGTLYKLDVTAQAKQGEFSDDTNTTYVVLPGNSQLPLGSEEFEDYASQLERALAGTGYRRVSGDDPSEARVAIYLAAAISEPMKEYHTVRSSHRETVDPETASAAVRASGNPSGGAGGGLAAPVEGPKSEEISGFAQNSFATTVFTKHLNLIAIDLEQYLADVANVGKSEAIPRELWSVDVSTTGTPDNLQEVIPVMLAAARPYIGKNPGETVRVNLDETSRLIAEIRDGGH